MAIESLPVCWLNGLATLLVIAGLLGLLIMIPPAGLLATGVAIFWASREFEKFKRRY